MSINLGQSGSLEPSFPFYRKKAILRATHLFLRRSAGPLSSGVLVGGRDERSARLLGGRACIAVGSRSSSFCIPPASSISPARVRVLVQLSGDNGFGGFVSGEICMRYVCRVCRGALLRCGFLFLAMLVRRWWWRRRGIRFPGPFLAPLAFPSDVNGGTRKEGIRRIPCVGVRVVDCSAVSLRWWLWRRVLSRVLWWLREVRQDGVRIKLQLPTAPVVGELWSRIGGARGVFLADVHSTMTSSRPPRRVTTAAQFKASCDGVPPDLGRPGRLLRRRPWSTEPPGDFG
jgi:hypothetical protein